MNTQSETLFELRGGLGLITLNRPDALNALSPGQFGEIAARLRRWAQDESVRAVAIKGAGERAFCAGGDIKAVWDGRQRGLDAGNRELFRDEYRLDRLIHHYPKPIIALIDGIVMGGGAGISVNGRFRVVTERALFAMPETAIGFFPDVGATHFLGRCPGRLGLFLGLTGTRLGAAEMLAAGLATHATASTDIDSLVSALADQPDVVSVLRHFHQDPGHSWLEERLPLIDRVTDCAGPGEMLAGLDGLGVDWARQAAAAMRAASPTSLKITWRQLSEGRGLGFDQAIMREFRLACTLLQGSEFHEGIRALVIDKDKSPRWSPAHLDAVPDEMVERLFQGAGDELTFPEAP